MIALTVAADSLRKVSHNAISATSKVLLTVANKWGIFAAMVVGFFMFLLWAIVGLYKSHIETHEYVRNTLMSALTTNSVLYEKLIDEMEEASEEREEIKKVLLGINNNSKQEN